MMIDRGMVKYEEETSASAIQFSTNPTIQGGIRPEELTTRFCPVSQPYW
jgi:hypothetical protein